MSIIKPFKALRPYAAHAAKVASLPYDVMNRAEAKTMAEGNPYSFLHITRAEIDLPDTTNIHSEEVYEQAKINLFDFVKNQVLFTDEAPSYYIYTLVMAGRSQTGIVALSSVEEYNTNLVKKHEFTRPEKEQDRINHMLTIGAQTGNVFLAYNDVATINNFVEAYKNANAPEYDFTANDGIQHTIWCVANSQQVSELEQLFLQEVPHTYIADGHHRAASAAKVNNHLPNNEQTKYFLTTLFPASQLAILDYNRVIKDTNGLSENELVAALENNFIITPAATAVKPTQLHQMGMYINKNWYSLQAKEGTYTNDEIGVLDVTILQNLILTPLFNIIDQRTDKRIDFVGGIRGIGALEQRVDSGDMAVAFSLYPVSIQQLFNIADKNEVMPPKSTWFEPKLRDGLLTHVFA
jgi:uncharacterized protein (DUF1015 family)